MVRMAVVLAAVIFATTPVLAAEKGMDQAHEKMKQLMKSDPNLKKQLMNNPHHILAMAHLKSLKNFSHGLKMAAQKEETVSKHLLESSVEEMKHNLDLAEKHRKEMIAGLPEETKAKLADMQKMIDEHLKNAREHLGHLEQLASKEKIESKEVLKHLGLMMPACDKMEKMHDHGAGKKKLQKEAPKPQKEAPKQ